LSLTPAEQAVVLARFRRLYGANVTRVALIAYLEGQLRAGDPAVRDRAEQLLATLRGEQADAESPDSAVAVKLLSHANARIRAEAIGALGTLGSGAKRYVKDLMRALKDSDADVRLAAAAALGEISNGPDEMFDALAKASQDPVTRVRTAAVGALVRLKDLPW